MGRSNKQKVHETTIFGFRLKLVNPPTRMFEDEEILDIDYEHLGYELIDYFLISEHKLTGSQIRFMRKHMNLTQEEVATAIGKKQANLSRDESKGNKPAFDGYADELAIRAYFLTTRLGQFKKAQRIPKDLKALSSMQNFYRPANQISAPETTVTYKLAG